MQISTQTTFNKVWATSGFSLIEILVALLLAALMFMAVPSGDSTQRHRHLKAGIDNIDRAVRFAQNEAILRNSIVRLKLDLESNPVNYTVEYGPSGNVPLPEIPDLSKLSIAERKMWSEQQKKFSSQFTPVEEFEDIKYELHEEVMVLGVGVGDQKGLIQEGEVSVYFYPTGEKDAALFFLATIEEFAYLEVSPFLNRTKTHFEALNTESVSRLEDILQTRMTTIYSEWR
ncbi:MAG TPA: prepilin-type N-terminal cleavage/methylation domain-containing protein [Bacteriovoracaceae bacterium]|nr:prepilin-type N-terminal cleavage/methylation domain-containing protein [Bacteriovoracaceae bacterium]